MIAAVDAWIKGIVFVVLFAAFLDLLLPNSSMQKFVRVIMGLFIMLAILTPVIDLVDKNPGGIEIAVGGEVKERLVLAEMKNAQDAMQNKRQHLTREHYASDLAKQIRATVLSIGGVADAKAAVRLREISNHENEKRILIPQIAQVDILVKPKSENFSKEMQSVTKIYVNITNAGNSSHENDILLSPAMKEKIERVISELYYISTENIQVRLAKD
jgi:stage III sporulation protein AF